MELFPDFDFLPKPGSEGGANQIEKPSPPHVSAKVMTELIHLAGKFRAQEPWDRLNENELFGVRDPDTNELHLVSVLGKAGAVFSLHCHLAPEGIQFWQNALRGIAPKLSPGLPEIRLLECDFVNTAEARAEDIAIYDKHAKRPRRKKALPCFRSYQPGFYPWFIDEFEARKLILIFKLFDRFFKEIYPKKKQFYQWKNPFGEMPGIPVFYPSGAGPAHKPENWAVKMEVLPYDATPYFGREYNSELNLSELDQFPIVNEIWEIGTFFIPSPIFNGPRPYYPKTAICLRVSDAGSKCPCDPIVYGGHSKSDYEAVRQCFRELVHHCHYLPEKIRVGNRMVKAALRSMIEDFDIEMTFDDQQLMPALITEITNSIADSDLNWEDEILREVIRAIPQEFHSTAGDEDLDRTILAIAEKVFLKDAEDNEEEHPINVILADFGMAASDHTFNQMD